MAVLPAIPSSLELGHEKANIHTLADQETLPIINYEDQEFLIVSPYHEKAHLLDLKTVDTANQLLAKALVGLKCLREDYATAPYIDIFNVSINAPKRNKEKLIPLVPNSEIHRAEVKGGTH
jgi:hypothetical protein